MPYPPLAVFSYDVLSCSSHCIQEGHLVKTFHLQVEKKVLNEAEESGVRGKENGHHSRMGVKPVCDCTGMVECHTVPCDHIYPTCPLSTSGTSLSCRSSKMSHSCRSALFHTRSAQRGPLLLYTVWSCD